MKKVLISGAVASIVLLILSYGILFVTIRFFPHLVEEYYNPVFWPGNDRAMLFFAHPFVLGFALSWFWNRAKPQFSGEWWWRGTELGLVYGVVATAPSMWITFSSISVSATMVGSWFAYGLLQATVSGLIFARLNP
jgi:hypothetical protein